MKKALLSVLSTLLGLLFVPTANAQWCDEICQGQRDAYGIIRSARQRHERNLVAADVRHVIRHVSRSGYPYGGGYYDDGYGYGAGYGYRDEYGRPIGGGRISRDVGAGLLGAAAGGAFGGRRGALIGGAAAIGAAELGGHLMARRGGYAAAGPSAGGGYSADLELVNSTGVPIELYFVEKDGKEKPRGRMSSGAVWPIDGRRLKMPKADTREAFVGYAVIPNRQGGLSSDRLVPTPTETGWEFREPDFGREGR